MNSGPPTLVVSLLVSLVVVLSASMAIGQGAPPTQITPTNDTGLNAHETYSGAHENIGLSNGNLALAIPLLSLPGRDGLNLNLGIQYNSKIWAPHATFGSNSDILYNWRSEENGWQLGDLGWTLDIPFLNPGTIVNDPTLGMIGRTPSILNLPGGGKTSIEFGGAMMDSQDGSFASLARFGFSPDGSSNNTAIAYLKDGTKLHFPCEGCAADTITDTNGNFISITTVGSNQTQFIDTLGRQVTMTQARSYPSQTITVSYKDSNGATQNIVLKFSALTLFQTTGDATTNQYYTGVVPFLHPQPSDGASHAAHIFVSQPPSNSPYMMLTEIDMPSNLSYTFSYNGYGELIQVNYPIGGYTKYGYSASQHGELFWNGLGRIAEQGGINIQSDFREVICKRVCRNASGTCKANEEDVTTYAPTISSTRNLNNDSVDVKHFLNEANNIFEKTTVWFTNTTTADNMAQYYAPRETMRSTYAADGTLLRSVSTSYNSELDIGYATLPTSVVTTLYDFNPPLVTKTDTQYDTYSATVRWPPLTESTSYQMQTIQSRTRFIDNPLTQTQYGYGQNAAGSVLRITNSTWWKSLWNNNHIWNRRLTQEVQDGTAARIAYTTFEYDNYTERIAASGATQLAACSGSACTSRGNQTAVSHWRNTDGAMLTTRRQFDDAGNVLKVTDPAGFSTTFSFADNYYNLTPANATSAFVTGVTRPTTNGVDHITRSQYYFNTGLVDATCGENFPSGSKCEFGLAAPQPDYVSYTYDLMNRPLRIARGDGGGTNLTYNDTSLPISVSSSTTIDGTHTLTRTSVYDGLGRQSQTQLNSDPSGVDYVDTTYDALGRVAAVSNPHRSSAAPTDGTTQTQYDALGRVTQVTKQDGSVATISYSGNCATSTDEAGNLRKTCSDALGRLIEVDEPNAAASGTNATASVTISGALGSRSQPGATPAAPGSALNTYLDAGGTGHVAYLNANNHLINVSVNNAGPQQIQDLTALSGAPPSAPGSMLANYGSLSTVLNESSNQHIYQTFLNGSSWVNNDLTAMAGTSVVGAQGTAIVSYLDSPNEHTFYLGTDNHVYQLFWNGASMSNLDLTALSGGSPAMAGSKLASFNDNGAAVVAYQGTNQHIYQIYSNGSSWINNDLTALAGTTTVGAPGTSLATYLNLNTSREEFFYLGSSNHVYDLYWNGSSMSNLDLTALAGGVPALAGSKLASFSNMAVPVVAFQGTNQHIYQIYLNGSSWVSNDLTAMAGTTVVGASGTAIATLLSPGSESFFYQGTDNHVYELLWNGSAMVNLDLSTSSPDTDSGTVSLAVGNFTATACFGPSTNPACSGQTENVSSGDIALALSRALDSSASPVSATASGATLSMIWKTPGTTTATVGALGTTDDNPSVFPNPSFTSPATNFVGGTGPSLSTAPYVTQYQYDALGNLLRVDQKGSAPNDSTQWRTRLFTYDSLSRLLTAYNPESGTISYSYDADGNLLQKTSPAPNQVGSATQTISYCYDALNRVTGKAYTAQTCTNGLLPSSTAAVSYTYDQGTNGIGHMTSLTDQAGSGSYSYDVMGRVASESRTISRITKSMGYGYNLDGSLATLTYPSTAAVTYTPDAAGRMLSAIDNGNGINYATAATYDATSALTGFVSGKSSSFAGITNTFSFSKRLQPVFMSAATPTNTVFSIGYDFHFGNGDNGNVYSLTNNRDHTRDQTFAYDALNRLISAQNAETDCTQKTLNSNQTKFWGNIYGYDAWGNLVSKDVTKCSAEALDVTALANNRLSGYGYDAAGNMTYDATTENNYSYDQENRITGAAGYTYTYDDDGNRVEKTNGSTGTLYWYMAPGIVAESDLAGNLQSEYVFFDGERVARKDFPSNAVSYYFSDHLKTTNIVTDAQGNIKNESAFYPWGGELPFVANDSNHYKFAGKERDSETQLDYFGARYYSNRLGRFITPDWAAKPAAVPYAVLGDPQTLNLYTYVRNIPTSTSDLDGHCETTCQIAKGVAIGVGKFVWNNMPWNGGQHAMDLAKLAQKNPEGARAQVRAEIRSLATVAQAISGDIGAQVQVGIGVANAWNNASNTERASAVTQGVLTLGTAVAGGVAMSGASTETTLTRLATQAVDNLGPGSGGAYGTAVHSEWANLVEGNTNLATEVSYKGGQVVEYGTAGSVRVDAVSPPLDAPPVVYDLKTGSATLTPARISQIQNELPGGSNVPVREIKPE